MLGRACVCTLECARAWLIWTKKMDTIINTAPGREGGRGGLFILVSFSTSWPPALVNALGCVWVMRSGVKWGFAGGEGIRGVVTDD